MRERGSSTARPTENGVGGLLIRSRFGRFGASIRSISSRFADFLLAFRPDSVAIRSIRRVDSVASCRFGALLVSRFGVPVVPIRSRRVDSDHRGQCRSQGANTKKARFLNRGIGLSYRKASRALNLRLVPLSNTCASARSVLRGLARRSCIVMITSGRRHIVHYTLQNMRTHGQS